MLVKTDAGESSAVAVGDSDWREIPCHQFRNPEGIMGFLNLVAASFVIRSSTIECA